jgi:hypothetical protein
MVVESVGEALAWTAAEMVALDAAANAACRSSEPHGQVGAAACGASPPPSREASTPE